MTDMRLSELWRFPVKSLRGQRFASLSVVERGFVHDREWMVVDPNRRFLTQRQLSRMALIDTRVRDDRLVLAASGMHELVVEIGLPDGESVAVQVWSDTCKAIAPDPRADAWLSEFLDTPCRLVQMPADVRRPVDPTFARPEDSVGFADGFPFLLIGQAALDDLNARLDKSLPMLRFRPNLVVTGTRPFEEDEWRKIRIGELVFRVAKPCSRCIVPTIDPATAERYPEPLKTLMSYRRRDNKIFFGQNLLHDGTGLLAQGMAVEVLETVHG